MGRTSPFAHRGSSDGRAQRVSPRCSTSLAGPHRSTPGEALAARVDLREIRQLCAITIHNLREP
jgi:hypothetical protein